MADISLLYGFSHYLIILCTAQEREHTAPGMNLREFLFLVLMLLQYDGICKEGVLSCSVRLNYPLYDTVETDIFHCVVVFFREGYVW